MAYYSYRLMDRYVVQCQFCRGRGCCNCRDGEIPVYVIATGHRGLRCFFFGHRWLGSKGRHRVNQMTELPQVMWCRWCTRQQIQTDTPEAYDLETLRG